MIEWLFCICHMQWNLLLVVHLTSCFSLLKSLCTFFSNELEDEIRKQVDQLMREELQNLKLVNLLSLLIATDLLLHCSFRLWTEIREQRARRVKRVARKRKK